MASSPNVTRLPVKPTAILTRAADIEPRPVAAIWPGVAYDGKVTLMVGNPGDGKSVLTSDIISRHTTGAPWPCSTERREPGDAMLLSAEDDPEDTIVPRLIAAGADLDRVTLLHGVLDETDGTPKSRLLALDRDIEVLDNALRARPAQLIVIDPLSSYLGHGTDSHNEGDVRVVLAPLAELARKHNAAVLGIRHLRKGSSGSPQDRVIGSVAFTAFARAVYAIVRDPDDPDTRLMLCLKNNLARDNVGYRYTLRSTADDIPYVVWDEEHEIRSAEEILGASAGPERPVHGAEQWLLDVLARGPVPSEDLRTLAKQAGHAWRTVERARKNLAEDRSHGQEIVIERIGGRGSRGAGRWQWRLSNSASSSPPLPAPNSGGVNRVDQTRASSTFSADGDIKTATPPSVRAREGDGGYRCPRCAGEGCRWCGDTGRNPDLL